MAVVAATRVTHPFDGPTALFRWTLTNGDTAMPAITPVKADKTVTVEGTFGGATLALQGSCNPASGAALDTLLDPFQNLMTFTARGTRSVMQNTYQVAPALSGGAGSTVDVYLLVQGG